MNPSVPGWTPSAEGVATLIRQRVGGAGIFCTSIGSIIVRPLPCEAARVCTVSDGPLARLCESFAQVFAYLASP